ncbi:MAG: hypothetical protein JW953_00170 [Anaerolineae bacterium]|nr:hypothetical protein [Anaerolineae bacterium]
MVIALIQVGVINSQKLLNGAIKNFIKVSGKFNIHFAQSGEDRQSKIPSGREKIARFLTPKTAQFSMGEPRCQTI